VQGGEGKKREMGNKGNAKGGEGKKRDERRTPCVSLNFP